MNKIDYAFTAVPSRLIEICDNYTFKLITFLINKHNYFNSVNRLDAEGYFYLSNEDISKVLYLNQKDVCLVNEALYKVGIIDIKCIGFELGKRKTNRYNINFEVLEKLAKSTDDITIEKCKRGTKCSYINNSLVANCDLKDDTDKTHRLQIATNSGTNCDLKDDISVANCDPTLDYNNINDIIDINVYNTNNINEEETVKNDNNTSNIEDNNDESIEDYYKRMYEEEKEIIDEMNKRYEDITVDDNDNNNFNNSNVITIDDLPLQQWITKLFNDIDNFNDKFFNSRTVEDAKYYSNKLDRLFEKAQQYQDVFTDKQYKLLQTKADRCVKIDEQKYNYFNGRNNKGKHNHQPTAEIKSFESNTESGNYSAPTPPTPEDVHNQMMEDLINRF